jgi:transposase
LHHICAAAGLRLLFLAPYAPDTNPIELVFRALKANLRTQRDLTPTPPAFLALILDLLSSMRYDCSRLFAACGYTEQRV